MPCSSWSSSHPEHVEAELRHLLPAAVCRRIDWRTLRLLNGGRVDSQLRGHHADLIYSVELRDRNGLLYIVLEHKSGPCEFTALQLLRRRVREAPTEQLQRWAPRVLTEDTLDRVFGRVDPGPDG